MAVETFPNFLHIIKVVSSGPDGSLWEINFLEGLPLRTNCLRGSPQVCRYSLVPNHWSKTTKIDGMGPFNLTQTKAGNFWQGQTQA